MKKITDLKTALTIFEGASNQHAKAIEKGDYQAVNKNYGIVINAVKFIKSQNEIDALLDFLTYPSVGVRLSAAIFLLPQYEGKALNVLQEIAGKTGILSLTAKMTIDEWEKGNLKHLYG
jgi:hypothetical protein